MDEICEVTEARCACKLPKGHEGLHECKEVEICDGSWGFDEKGGFLIGRLPKAWT